ncbi:MAG: phage tail protein [Clostridiales bacterium]|nr:phage tail protein [Clostridiales bacterium]
MADNTTEYVSTGAPKVGGYAYTAPLGSTLPTDATTALDEAFVSLGFISEDGVTNSNSPESEDIKDWGGTTVLSTQTAKDDTWQFTLIESKNANVLKMVYGEDNVTGDLSTGITIKANSDELSYAAYAFDMVLRNGTRKRIVLPNAKVTEIGDISYTRSDAIGYEITLTCAQDTNGNTHYEYIAEA